MSAKPAKLHFGFKLAIALVIIVAGTAALILYLRPVAIVAPVGPGEALDAKPASVTVVEEYAEELRTVVPGRVLARDFNLDPGKAVKKGDVLAQLDPTDDQLELNQEKIDYRATQASFAADHTTQLKLDTAHADLANARRLNKLGLLPDNDLAAKEREVKGEEQGFELEKIAQQQKLDTFANTIKIEEHKIEELTLRAPFDGVASQVYAHPGDLIPPNTSLATLITNSKVVVGKISEEDFAQVRVGESATVTFLPYGDWDFDATVLKILPTADPETQRHVVHLDVKVDADHPLQPGINGEATIIVDRRAAKTIVPRRALFTLNGDAVYVVKDGRVELRMVKKGYVWARGAEILEGLAPGEEVIVEQLEQFQPGERVRVREIPSDVTPPRK